MTEEHGGGASWREQRHEGSGRASPTGIPAFPADLSPLPGEGFQISTEVRIPSDVRYIERVVEIVRRHCAEMGFEGSQLTFNIPVALTEAISNAILRGNREDPAKGVFIRAMVTPARLVVDIRDEGKGFDLSTALSDPTRPENLEREDGRGLFLMRKLMDRVERLEGATTTVRLVLQRG